MKRKGRGAHRQTGQEMFRAALRLARVHKRLRIGIALLVFSCLAAAQQVVPTTARVEGQVTSVTGEPLANASVQLQTPRPGLPQYGVETDLTGNFVIENVAPGLYTLSASRTGYLKAQINDGKSFTLASGQARNGFVIRLMPEAMISGEVTGAEAQPMDRVKVNLYRRLWRSGRWELAHARLALTGPDGKFQLDGLAAGRYYLSAEEGQISAEPEPAAGEESYVTTYYPAALDPVAALPIEIGSGEPIHVDVRLRKERAYRIRGKVINSLTGAPVVGFPLEIARLTNDSVGLLPPKSGQAGKAEGSFQFDRLLPGRYLIYTPGAFQPHDAQSEAPLVGRETVNLSDLDVDDLILRLAPPTDVTGVIRTEGSETQPSPQLGVGLMVADDPAGYRTEQSHNKADGTFVIPAVAPGVYEVLVSGLPPGNYVKSMRFGGQDLINRVLDNTSGAGGSLDIVLSPDVADVSGAVQNDSVDATPRMQVTLWGSGIIRHTQSGAKGAFRFRDLPPGSYQIVAWEQVDSSLTSIPDFLARFENQAASVTVGPKDHGTVQVQFVKRESVEAEAAKFR